MPEVESNNYSGKCRRKNGARLKLSARDWIYVGTLFIALILAWGNMKFTTDATAKQTNRNTSLVDVHQTEIAVLKNSVGNIERDINEIKNILLGKKETWGARSYIATDKSVVPKVQ